MVWLWYIFYLESLGIRISGGSDIEETIYFVLVALGAFWLGACPFSVWIGHWLLGKDIRQYGDGNPGAANVFRAGGHKAGCLALILDMAKGVPFVFMAHYYFAFPDVVVVAVALCAILGHSFSPLLKFKGGKAVAITFGVLMVLPEPEMLAAFTVFVLFGFIVIGSDAWAVVLGPAGSFAYMAVTRGNSWESLFMLCVLVLFVVKYHRELHTVPRPKGRFFSWLQSRRQT